MAAMSTNGRLVIATHNGHHIQIEEPEFVIPAIRDVLTAMPK
jgi:hypothetical protein